MNNNQFDRAETRILTWIRNKGRQRNWSRWISFSRIMIVLLAIGLIATLLGPDTAGNRFKDAQSILFLVLLFAVIIHNARCCRLIEKLTDARTSQPPSDV